MKRTLLIASLLLVNYICSASTDKCSENDKVAKSSRLHHIIEFGKRSKVEGKGCTKSSSKSSEHILGLHGLLHARSKKNNTQNVFDGTKKVSSNKTITPQKPKNEAGSKRTNALLHKVQLRKETISMLHKIVEKYFPGGHLTVEQKIKALKILGKLIKLKKEGKNSDIKKLLGALSTHKPSNRNSDYSDVSKEKKKSIKNEESGKKDNTGEGGGDIYANIASGPDVPKLPPSVSGKDPDHAHSNIMPVGLQPLGRGEGASEMMRTLTQPNDISDNLNDRISSYQAPIPNSQGAVGLGQIYRNRNNLLRNGMGLSGIPNMMDGQGYARSRMPYPRTYWLNARRRYYSDEDDDDDDEDEDDDDESDEDEEGQARSYVNRHHFYDNIDDDDDDDDGGDNGGGAEIEYSRRFDRKNKIAKIPRKLKKKSLK